MRSNGTERKIRMKQKKHVGKRLLAGLLGAVLLQTAVSIPSGLQASAADEVEYNYAQTD